MLLLSKSSLVLVSQVHLLVGFATGSCQFSLQPFTLFSEPDFYLVLREAGIGSKRFTQGKHLCFDLTLLLMIDQLRIGRLRQALGGLHQLLENLAVVLKLGLLAREHVGQITLDIA